MNGFQQTVVIIAIIILILCLPFSAIALHNHQKKVAYPPIVASCPDYWIEDENGTCTPGPNFPNANLQESCKSLNSKNMSKCDKHRWAKGCDLTWDGISNNTSLCGKNN